MEAIKSALRIDPAAPGAQELLERARADDGLTKNLSLFFDFYYRGEKQSKFKNARARIAILLDQATLHTLRYFFMKPRPGDRVQVHFYDTDDYQSSLKPDSWSGGLFDGKIRIPLGDYNQNPARLKTIVFHEYAHAVIYRTAPNCPIWMNEGVAQALSGEKIAEVESRLRGHRGSFFPADRMKTSFRGLSPEQARLAYDMSYSMVEQLRRQKGFIGITKFLRELGGGGDFEAVFKKHFYKTYDRFYEDWKRSKT